MEAVRDKLMVLRGKLLSEQAKDPTVLRTELECVNAALGIVNPAINHASQNDIRTGGVAHLT